MQDCGAFQLELNVVTPARHLYFELDLKRFLERNFDFGDDALNELFQLSTFQRFPDLHSLHLFAPQVAPGFGLELERSNQRSKL